MGRPHISEKITRKPCNFFGHWLNRAMLKPNISLGSCTQMNGQGVPQDFAEALKWYQLAADQGNAGAQNNLGLMYLKGSSVPQDYVQAHVWLSLAVTRLSVSETGMRSSAMHQRDAVAKKMAPAQITEAERLAREWLAVHPQK